jgi:hypothetical protein
VNRFFLQLLYLPVTIFMASVNALGKALRSIQTEVPVGSVPGMPTPPSAGSGGSSAIPASGTANLGNSGFRNLSIKEKPMGVDNNQDLNGDDIKTVLYSIIFTKRDLEAILQSQKEDIVDYSTNSASYGAVLMSDFTENGEFKRPDSWDTNNYPPDVPKDKKLLTTKDIPPRDRHFIQIEYKVTNRISKNAADYERRKVQSLEAIARNTKPSRKP